MLPSLASLSCHTGAPQGNPATAVPPPVRLLGFDYWVRVLEQLDSKVAACEDVDCMCQTLRKTGKELGQQMPCDDAHFWERMCQIRVFLFYSPEYVPIASTSELDRWRKQYLLFCRVATARWRHNFLNALRTLGLVATVPHNAFYNCHTLNLTHLPEGITTIGDGAFENCRALALTQLPVGVYTIEERAFKGCHALALTHLPPGIIFIEDFSFMNCHALVLTELPEQVTTIGHSAFANCHALVLTELPQGITTIGEEAFMNCNALALTHLPEGITSIGKDAFTNTTPEVEALVWLGID